MCAALAGRDPPYGVSVSVIPDAGVGWVEAGPIPAFFSRPHLTMGSRPPGAGAWAFSGRMQGVRLSLEAGRMQGVRFIPPQGPG